jgi:DNA-binding NarL/FixJ family response regulator
VRLALGVTEELVLEALEHLFSGAGLEVVGRCTSAAEVPRCVRARTPDIALIETALAGPVGMGELVRAVTAGSENTRIVFLAPAVDCALARATIELAVDGVVLKGAAADDVVATLRRIGAGDAVFPAGWLAAARRAGASLDDALSPRQLEVLELLGKGLPNDVIANRLFISRNTVKFHIAVIYQRLGVHNRVEAVQALWSLRAAG